MTQLFWTGLGNIGRGMVANIAKKGKLTNPLLVHNRTIAKAGSFVKTLPEGSAIVSTLEDGVSKSDIIFSCLGDDAAVLETYGTMVKQATKGKLFVDCSTVHPETTLKLKDQIEKTGASFLGMPVFGAPAAADAGQLVAVVAGPPDALERIKPYLEGVTSKAIIDLTSSGPDAAGKFKLIGNSLILNMITAISEASVLAEKNNIPQESVEQLLSFMFPNTPYVAYEKRMASGDYHKREYPLFAVDLAKKDARHILDLGKQSGLDLRTIKAADHYLDIVKQESGANGDIAGIYGAARKEAGLSFKN